MNSTLDIDFVRAQFPAFSEASLKGQAHFENAGGSYACQQVISRLYDYYRCNKVQPYYAFAASSEAGKQMDTAYIRLAEYLNVPADTIHIGPSTSQNTAMLAQAFRSKLTAGDEVIVTNQDHEANSGVWRKLVEVGVVVREWCVDADTGALNVEDLDTLINEKTKLLAFPHCSNVVAYINPVAEICAKAKAANVITVVDGVSFAGHGLPDIAALGADVYLFSLYKTYGPHQGVMTVSPAVATLLGNQSHFFNEGEVHKQFVPAGPDHAQVAATNGVLEYFDALYEHHVGELISVEDRAQQVRSLMRNAELSLLAPLLDYLDNRSDLRVLGSVNATERAATVSFVSQQQSSPDIARALSDKGIMAGNGHFYAYRLMKAMQVEPEQGAVRLSFVHYTHANEMQKLLTSLDQVLVG